MKHWILCFLLLNVNTNFKIPEHGDSAIDQFIMPHDLLKSDTLPSQCILLYTAAASATEQKHNCGPLDGWDQKSFIFIPLVPRTALTHKKYPHRLFWNEQILSQSTLQM